MEEEQAQFEQIEKSFDALRNAVEERNYSGLELLLRRQRSLMSSAPASDPRTQTLALKGSALISWALTMVKIQNAGYTHDLAAILNTNRLFSHYKDADSTDREHISINA